LELDDAGAVISYEEYYPYGSTSYQAGRSVAEVGLKRYRYTGKERDEESGLYYHGARYYAAWLGRWVSADPAPTSIFTNLYIYAANNPIILYDSTGLQEELGLLSRLSQSYRAIRLAIEFQARVVQPFLNPLLTGITPPMPVPVVQSSKPQTPPLSQGSRSVLKSRKMLKDTSPPKTRTPPRGGKPLTPPPPPPPPPLPPPHKNKELIRTASKNPTTQKAREAQRKISESQRRANVERCKIRSARGVNKGPSPNVTTEIPEMAIARGVLSVLGWAALFLGAVELAAEWEGYYHIGPMKLPERPTFRVVARPNATLRYITLTKGYIGFEMWGRWFHTPISYTVEFPEGTIEAELIFNSELGEYKLGRFVMIFGSGSEPTSVMDDRLAPEWDDPRLRQYR
jgi:RHS repeat-associated protein